MVLTKSKKGSYIMEAAVVMPLIIFAVITVVLIIMFFYSQMTERSKMHMVLRQKAGIMTNHTATFNDVSSDGEFYSDRGAIGGTVYGKKYLIMEHRGLLRKKGSFTVEGSCYGTDGTRYVRYCNLIKGVKGHDQ
ncbi:MAG: hypothetical protein GX663_02895 [Clostridiales bacterium]|nr:hypothetical protein [Clostridiales bacterium]